MATKNVALFAQLLAPENAEVCTERLFNSLSGLCALCGERLRHVTWWCPPLFWCYSLRGGHGLIHGVM